MAKKVLNLDEILQVDAREVVLGGKTYVVNEMSVTDYIATTKVAERLKDNKDTEIQMKETAALIQRQIPDVDVEFLMKLSIDRLYAIAEFVRGVDPEEIVKRAMAAQADTNAQPAAAVEGTDSGN